MVTYEDYVAQVYGEVSREALTMEQGMLMCACFKATLDGSPVHINYLMHITDMNWRKINWTLNGLVQRGAIRKIEDKLYMV